MTSPSASDVQTMLTILQETPPRIGTASQGFELAKLHYRPDAKTWSANDILAHLRVCADVWGRSIGAMLEQDHPTIQYVSPRTWLRKTDYLKQEFHESFAVFAAQRNLLINSLKHLTLQDWSRGATMLLAKQPREETVFSYARRIALHELVHCEQIETLLKQEPLQ